MRIIYKVNDGEGFEEIIFDGPTTITNSIDKEDVDQLVADGEATLYDSSRDMRTATEYQRNRFQEYPSIQSQLDQIYHEGIDAWKETIQAVKDANPKP